MRIDELLKKTDTETTLLILICRVYLDTYRHDQLNLFIQENHSNLDYGRLYQLVKRHRIRPVVYKVLSSPGVFPDEELFRQLGTDNRVITLQALNNLNEMFRVISLLKGKGIEVLPYRGPLFSKMYYDDWAMRESSDLDFLIDKKHIQELDSLKKEGYKAKHIFNDYRDKDIHKNSQSIDLNNDDGIKRNIHLEFHYNIVAACYGVRSGYADAQQNTVEFEAGSQKIQALSHESATGIILAHHGLQDIWSSLKYYMDLAMLSKVQDPPDWKQVEVFTRKHGYHKLSEAAFHNMELLTGVINPFSNDIKDNKFAGQLLDLCLSPDIYKHKGFYKLNLRIKGRDTLLWKFKMISGLLTLFFRPTTDDFEWKYFPPHLFWLYYICKPPRLIYKYLLKPLTGKNPVFPFR